MKNKFTIILVTLLLIALGALATLYAMTHTVAVLDPKGMIAIKQRKLLITTSMLMLIVVIPVLLMTLFIAWRYAVGNKKAKYSPNWAHSHFAEMLWWGVPFVIIIILGVITWASSHELDPFKPLESNKKPLAIQVVALQWKWLFIYPEQGIATLNFIQFPKETPLNFEISADAPMNSFWIPQLGGQIYAMPSMRTKLHLIAHEIGEYRGSSAHLSGKGFAGMTFVAKASTEEEFEEWVTQAKNSTETLSFEDFNNLAMPTEYAPVTYYRVTDRRLFDQIVAKYDPPKSRKQAR